MKSKSSPLLLLVTLMSFSFLWQAEAQSGDEGQLQNPIVVNGPVESVSRKGDIVTIRLVRNKYPIEARAWQPVHRNDKGRKLYAADLIVGDSLEVLGELDRNVIYAERIKLLLRIERRPAP